MRSGKAKGLGYEKTDCYDYNNRSAYIGVIFYGGVHPGCLRACDRKNAERLRGSNAGLHREPVIFLFFGASFSSESGALFCKRLIQNV